MTEDTERNEWRDLTRGCVRHWLRHVARLKHKVENTREQIEELRETATGISGIDYTRDMVRSSVNTDAIPDAVIRLWDMIDEAIPELDEYVDALDTVNTALKQLSNPTHARIIKLHYLDGIEYKDIVERIKSDGEHWSEASVYRMSGLGLDELYWLMPSEYRVQVPQAS